jgi:hypothetical protein
MAEPAPVQELKVKALGDAEFHDRRGREHEHHGAPDAGERPGGPFRDGLGLQVRTVAKFPVPELDEHHAVALRPP